MRVLLIGGGGREHALALGLAADPAVDHLTAAPGNPGIADVAELHAVDPASPDEVAALAVELRADLVVVGPEAPLVAGVADAVRAKGIACFGPSKAAARLEGSKSFAKEVMAAAHVPTARAVTATDPETAAAALDRFGAPYVVKNDGLAAGKGVVVTDDRAAALAHAEACGRVVIEEYLDGPEVSLFVVTDGETAVPLMPAQDFKRIGDGDTGPNTGGMGAYTPLPWAPPHARRRRHRERRRADAQGDAAPRYAVRRPAVRRPRADLQGPAGGGVQRPLRRPGDPVGAGAAGDAAGRSAARRRHRHARVPPAAALAPGRVGHRRRRVGRLPGRGPIG